MEIKFIIDDLAKTEIVGTYSKVIEQAFGFIVSSEVRKKIIKRLIEIDKDSDDIINGENGKKF